MTAVYLNQAGNCPFWSMMSMKCRICKSGLFIPLDNHIEVYCKTPDYSHCLQYFMHPGNRLEISDTTRQTDKNRRKFERIEARLRITLVKHIHSGAIGSHCSTFAKTLDLSSGGMRLTTSKPLVNSSIVQFSFDNSFPENLHECSGQVAWCNKEIDVPGYQAGISFQDHHVVEAMDTYLEFNHRPM